MKVTLTEQQLKEHRAATIRGGLEGALIGSAIAAPASYLLHRRFPAYRHLPLSLKTLGAIVIVVPALAIQAERRGLQYDRSQWEDDVGLRVLDLQQHQTDAKWANMTTKDKVADWAMRHKYSVIIGGWAAGIAVAGGIISRDRYMTFSQKIVQARMWAQGLTIGLLIGAAVLSHNVRDQQPRQTDHSWREVVEQYEKQTQEERERIHSQVPTTRRGAVSA